MGISTIQSYCGAQIFEAVGLSRSLVDRHFTGTASRIGGVGLDVLARGGDRRATRRAYPHAAGATCCRSAGSTRGGATASTTCGTRTRSRCSSTPCAAAARRPTASSRGVSNERRDAPRDAARPARDPRATRRRSRSRRSSRGRRSSSASSTGAMSLGSLGREAHENLAIAMNRIGGKSNTGEGGEDPRALPRRAPLGDQAGRLGPLRRDDRLPRQRRRAADQDGAGREAGRGRAAPGRARSTSTSARSATRRPGVGLISPPPHHDIYSIEDLKQLIYDLRCANPTARDLGQARRRGRRRHRRRRRREGQQRPRPDLRPRRRHRRLAALVDLRERNPVGDRPRRDPADAAAQRPALAHLGAGRRAAEDRPRRRRSPRCSAPTRWASRRRR